MTIKLLDGEQEICISGVNAATDGIYVSIEKFAYMNNVPANTAMTWYKRDLLPGIKVLGRRFVKKDAPYPTRVYHKSVTKNVQKCKS